MSKNGIILLERMEHNHEWDRTLTRSRLPSAGGRPRRRLRSRSSTHSLRRGRGWGKSPPLPRRRTHGRPRYNVHTRAAAADRVDPHRNKCPPKRLFSFVRHAFHSVFLRFLLFAIFFPSRYFFGLFFFSFPRRSWSLATMGYFSDSLIRGVSHYLDSSPVCVCVGGEGVTKNLRQFVIYEVTNCFIQ